MFMSPSFSLSLSYTHNNTIAEVTTSTSNHLHGPQWQLHMFICQYFKCHSIAAPGEWGGYCNYKMKVESEYKSHSSG